MFAVHLDAQFIVFELLVVSSGYGNVYVDMGNLISYPSVPILDVLMLINELACTATLTYVLEL